MTEEKNYNVILATGYLAVGLLCLFFGMYGLYHSREIFGLMYLFAHFTSEEFVDPQYLAISILFIWTTLLFVAFFSVYYKKTYGRIIGAIACALGILTSFTLYWGGLGAVFLILFIVLLIYTKTHWETL
jgi:hypothetical protein